MADNEAKKSILAGIQEEMKAAKRKAVKDSVKAKFADLVKARAVVDGIEQAIIAELETVGETAEEIRALLSGD